MIQRKYLFICIYLFIYLFANLVAEEPRNALIISTVGVAYRGWTSSCILHQFYLAINARRLQYRWFILFFCAIKTKTTEQTLVQQLPRIRAACEVPADIE